MPLVSIIIPCYNAERYVAEAIQSALDQTYPHREVIVIDDGSTDSSLGVIQSFGDKIRWETGPNRGGGAARNLGLEMANGTFVKFLDADDVLLADSVSTQVGWLAKIPGHCIPFGLALDYDTRAIVWDQVQTQGNESQDETVLEFFKSDLLITCPLHRVGALKAAGGFDVDLKRGQEWNLHLRLALGGVGFVRHEAPVFLYRAHGSRERISNRLELRVNESGSSRTLQNSLDAIHAHYGNELPINLNRTIFRKTHEHARKLAVAGLKDASATWFDKSSDYHQKGVSELALRYRILAKIFGQYYSAHLANVWRQFRTHLKAKLHLT